MKSKIKISASIVLYNEDLNILKKTIDCFLEISLDKKLYLLDNSPVKLFDNEFENKNIEYLFCDKNLGFGAGHNLAIEKIKNESEFHLILNPDVTFEANVIINLISKLEKEKEVAMIAPKVLFPNGSHQYSCRRYPRISELLVRRFSIFRKIGNSVASKGEYRDRNLNEPFFAEYLTGCFHLYKTKDFVKLNGFDERYFLYMEDVDICKKIDILGKKKLYYPKEEIIHVLKQGSAKNFKLFIQHLSSAIKYFLKWGF
jgi:GT2 family glycosyltransferase